MNFVTMCYFNLIWLMDFSVSSLLSLNLMATKSTLKMIFGAEFGSEFMQGLIADSIII